MSELIVDCPTCKTKVVWNSQSEYRPFCSKRCQLIDLGEWSEEQKVIPGASVRDPQGDNLPSIEDIEAMLAEQGDAFFKD